MLHVDEALLLEARQPSPSVAEANHAAVETVTKLKVLPVVDDLGGPSRTEPGEFTLVRRPDVERQPVRQVDEVFALDLASGDLRGEAIVAAGDVGARIVHPVGCFVGRGATRREEAVPHREQRFAATLEMRIEVVVGQGPGVLVGVAGKDAGATGQDDEIAI